MAILQACRKLEPHAKHAQALMDFTVARCFLSGLTRPLWQPRFTRQYKAWLASPFSMLQSRSLGKMNRPCQNARQNLQVQPASGLVHQELGAHLRCTVMSLTCQCASVRISYEIQRKRSPTSSPVKNHLSRRLRWRPASFSAEVALSVARADNTDLRHLEGPPSRRAASRVGLA